MQAVIPNTPHIVHALSITYFTLLYSFFDTSSATLLVTAELTPEVAKVIAIILTVPISLYNPIPSVPISLDMYTLNITPILLIIIIVAVSNIAFINKFSFFLSIQSLFYYSIDTIC